LDDVVREERAGGSLVVLVRSQERLNCDGPASRLQHASEEPAPERPAEQPRSVGARGRDLPEATRYRAAHRRSRQPLLGHVLLRLRAGAHEVNRMTIDTGGRAREKGIALVYVGVFLVPLLLCTGLAVDLGRGYLVRATPAEAVEAAALAAAHNLTAADSSQAQRGADH